MKTPFKLSHILTLLAIACTCLFSHAQSNAYSITGLIKDETGAVVEFGNVLILNPADSSLLQGTIFVDGVIDMPGVQTDVVLVKLTSLGYVDIYRDVDNSAGETSIALGDIEMPTNAELMAQFDVIGIKPVFEKEGDKIIVNVSTSDLTDAGSAADVLRKSPNVIKDADDNVSIFGRGAATVYVDGQKVNAAEVLSTIPSSEIESIEIIKNPDAAFDADGAGGVINIITKKNYLEGYNITLSNIATKGRHFYTQPRANFTYKKGKLNLAVSARSFFGKREAIYTYHRELDTDTSIVNMDNKVNEIDRTPFFMNTRIGLDYELNERNSLSLQIKNNVDNEYVDKLNRNGLSELDFVISDLTTTSTTHNEFLNNSATVKHIFKDTMGNKLSTAIEFSLFDTRSNAEIFESLSTGGTVSENNKRSLGNNDISILSAQTDYIKSWKERKITLQAGVKYLHISNISNQDFQFLSGGSYLIDPTLTSGYDFNEDISAGYLQLEKRIAKWQFRTGLRAELTQTTGFSQTLNDFIVDTTYFNLFPSAYVGYDFSDDLALGFTYSSRITRAGFSELQPYIEYIDSLSSFQGNPLLRPSYTHSVEGSLIYLGLASFDVGYTTTSDAMFLIVDKAQDGSNSFVAQTQNINKSDAYSIGLNLPYELKWWTTYNSFGWSYNRFDYNDNGVSTVLAKPMFYAYAYNEFRMPKEISLEVTFQYYSSAANGIFEMKPIHTVAASLSKKFLDGNLICRFQADDIFKTYAESGVSRLDGFLVDFHNSYDVSNYRFAITYKFGKLKAKDFEDKTINTDTENRVDR